MDKQSIDFKGAIYVHTSYSFTYCYNQIPNQSMPNQAMRPQPNVNQVPQNTLPNQPMPPTNQNNAQQFIKETSVSNKPKKKSRKISKELVSIIGVVLIVGILYFAYNYTLNKNLEVSTNIPVAATRILPGHRITEDDINYIDVPASTLRTIGALTDTQSILDKYVIYDTVIPEGSFFYDTVLSQTDQSPDSIFENLSDDQVAITIDVDLKSTYGNSIMPGNKVDIYVKAERIVKGESEYIIGPLVTNAEVLAVKDVSGNDVFADHENKLTPSAFMFAMPKEIANVFYSNSLFFRYQKTFFINIFILNYSL